MASPYTPPVETTAAKDEGHITEEDEEEKKKMEEEKKRKKRGGREGSREKKTAHRSVAVYNCMEFLSDQWGVACGFDSCCFSIDGSMVFLGCPNGGVYRWDTLTDKELSSTGMRGGGKSVHTVKASPDGRYICSAGIDSCHLWHLTARK